eukprot:g12038.t1
MGEWHDGYNFFGFIGGVILASALLPQIYLALRRRSTADISYVWQAVYTLGLLTLLVYYLHFQLWSVLYPMVFEFCCLMFLTSLKVYYEVFLGRVEQPTTDDAQEDLEVMRGAPLSRMPSKLALEALKSEKKALDINTPFKRRETELKMQPYPQRPVLTALKVYCEVILGGVDLAADDVEIPHTIL